MKGRLLETICIKDGVIQNIYYHNLRFNASRQALFPETSSLNLLNFIQIPNEYKLGIVKCRILYRAEIEEVQYIKYKTKKIEKVKVVETNLEYDHKWEDRTALKALLASEPNFDEILMVKDGFITDCSYANIVFKKDNEFFTPKKPLLKGTKRQHLLDEEILIEKNIKPSDLKKYSHFSLINAFNDFDLTKFLPIKNITYTKKSKKE